MFNKNIKVDTILIEIMKYEEFADQYSILWRKIKNDNKRA